MATSPNPSLRTNGSRECAPCCGDPALTHPRLTPMELLVAQLVSQGLFNKGVAVQCWVSPGPSPSTCATASPRPGSPHAARSPSSICPEPATRSWLSRRGEQPPLTKRPTEPAQRYATKRRMSGGCVDGAVSLVDAGGSVGVVARYGGADRVEVGHLGGGELDFGGAQVVGELGGGARTEDD